MKNLYFTTQIGKLCKSATIVFVLLFSVYWGRTQSITIPAGSFIINMGITPQTLNNGLKPYGLIYALLDARCPVYWIINPAKAKDGVDFTYNGVDYKGGPFIVDAQYRTTAINNLITTWTNPAGIYKVVGTNTTAPFTLPESYFYKTLFSVPRWTLDQQNGSIAKVFLDNASIPAIAYGTADKNLWPIPATLDCCDDLYIMPHADPVWTTHRYLHDWNLTCKGAIWLGCHAGSALENMFDNITTDGDPIDRDEQTNFLTEDYPDLAVGAGPWSDPGNALVLWGDHDDGTPPYTYNSAYAADPVQQYMGILDGAVQNGSEQIYIPVLSASAGWRPETKLLVYDNDHPEAYLYPATPMTHKAGILAYGPGFGNAERGNVMLEASHNIAGTGTANVAAQRAFLNFSFVSSLLKVGIPEMSAIANPMYSGTQYLCTFTWYGGKEPYSLPYTIQWSSSCGGTFTNGGAAQTVYFTPPASPNPVNCQISVTITDDCGRVSFDTHSTVIQCNLQVTTTITNPCFNTPGGGQISMVLSDGNLNPSWSWTRTEGGSGSGSGTTISGLSAGTYTVTVTSNGCVATFTVALSLSPQIIITATPVAAACNGGTGAINTTISGGIPGYNFSWTGPGGFTAGTQNLSGLAVGTYDLEVTDSKGCKETASATVTQPSAIVITPTVTDVTCFGENNGIINLSVSGGTSPYTFLWNDGNSSQNRTGLAPGTYAVTVTDGNNCTQTLGGMVVSQPAAALSLSQTHINVLCYGASTGSVDLTVTGGTTPYTSYAWTKTGTPGYSASSEDIGGLSAGTYNVTVTDSKGCTAVLSVEVTQPPALALSTTKLDPTCPPDADVNFADGSITLSVSGGVPSYGFAWTTGDGAIPAGQEDDQNLTTLIAGTYTVVVTDANSCTATTSVVLTYLNPNPVQPASIQH